MAERVAADGLVDAGQPGGPLDGFLERGGVDVVAANLAGSRVLGERLGGEDVLPAPLTTGVRIFLGQGVGGVDGAVAVLQILEVDHLDALEVLLEWNVVYCGRR